VFFFGQKKKTPPCRGSATHKYASAKPTQKRFEIAHKSHDTIQGLDARLRGNDTNESTQEQLIRRIPRLLGIFISKRIQKFLKRLLVPGRDLHAHQHAAEVGAVGAVVK
jgi:hypothetical protein